MKITLKLISQGMNFGYSAKKKIESLNAALFFSMTAKIFCLIISNKVIPYYTHNSKRNSLILTNFYVPPFIRTQKQYN